MEDYIVECFNRMTYCEDIELIEKFPNITAE